MSVSATSVVLLSEDTEVELPINTHVYFSVAQSESVVDAAHSLQAEEKLGYSDLAIPAPAPAATPQNWAAWTKKKVVENFLPLGFGFALIIAMAVPAPGKAAAAIVLPTINVFLIQAINNVVVFFISGITLNVNAFREILEHWKAVLFGIVSILFFTPLLGFIFLAIPLSPPEFSLGLAIFCCVPTTLGVGVALTTASEGNTSVALFLTVVTNIVGILTVPYMLQFILLASSNSKLLSFSPLGVFLKLIFTVLVPSLLGVCVSQKIPRARAFVAKRRTELSMFSTLNLVCIIWQTLSSASATLQRQSAANIVLMIALSLSLHGILLALIFFVTTRFLPLPIKERVAVTIMAAQKSAPVAVTLISYITQDPAMQGLLSIPALIGQLCQIFVGSALIARFRRLVKNG